jgi:hypothetical protein
VEVFLASAPDFQFWWNLLQTTGSRDGFRLHSKQYYQSMLQVAGMKLYLAKHQGLILAGISISGGGSLIRGLDRLLASQTGMPVNRVEDPLTAVVRGTGIVLDDMDTLKEVLIEDEQNRPLG